MRKLYALLAIAIFFQLSIAKAQNAGINDDGSAPNASAMLDVKSVTRGFLIPRMTRVQKNSIASPATGLMVYQADVETGIYINQGTPAAPNWQLLTTANNVWLLGGNAGTDPAFNFIGTKDDQPLLFKANNVFSGIINRTHLNTAFGYSTFFSNTSGTQNTALGSVALYNNTIGSDNSAIGASALLSNTSGNDNTANGYLSLYSNTTGNYNTAVGGRTLQSNLVGSYNTAVGYLANVGYGNLTNATAIGYNAQVSQSNSLILGNSDVNVGIGTTAPNPSSLLDLTSNSKGLLIPRMTATERGAITSPATGLIVYQTDGEQGMYLNQGTPSVPNWTLLTGANNVWSLNGNAGTSSANFIGTTDIQPLSFRVFNLAAGFINPSSSNTAFGIGTLVANTSGNLNTANGLSALNSNTTGSENTASGVASLQSNTTGSLNTATGNQSLLSNTEGTYNAAHGYKALFLNTTGTYNTAIGSAALFSNVAGLHNTALGSFADVTNANLVNATAIGYNAKVSQSNAMILGDNVNVGIGTSSPNTSSLLDLTSNSKGLLIPRMSTTERNGISSPATGLMVYDISLNSFYYFNGTSWIEIGSSVSANTWLLNGNSGTNPATQFIGTTDAKPLLFRVNNIAAGQIQVSNANTGFGLRTLAGTTGNYNTAVGSEALRDNTTGNTNSAFGNEALILNTTGGGNTAIGESTLNNNTIGNYNTAVGSASMYQSTTGSYNSAVGVTALMLNSSGSYNTAVGFDALRDNGASNYNTGIGYSALRGNSSGNANTATGYGSLQSNTTGSTNTANGYQALYSNTSGFQNSAIGYQTLYSNSTGIDNTATGHQALYSNTTGTLNTASGYRSLYANTTGIDNAGHGLGTLAANTTGSYNTANGATSLIQNVSGSYNTASGFESLYSNNESYNTAFGYRALRNTTTSQGNTAIGYNAGTSHNNGYYNVFVGANTDVSGDDFYNCIAIGQGVVCTDVNMAIIGNSATTKWGFGAIPGVGHALQVGSTSSNGNGAYLTSGGTWTNASSILFKEDFSELDTKEVLNKISALNISRWRYKETDEYHIGPVAEEFHALFNVGSDEQHLSTIDPSGVALAGIQELTKTVQEQKIVIEKQNDELKKLKEQVDALTKALEKLSSNK